MNLKKLLITLAKIIGSLAIVGCLFYLAVNTGEKRAAFLKLLQQQKEWDYLIGGFLVLLLAVVITMVRWWYLVRALGIDFSLRDALRIGFLGYLFNLAPAGIVGGDMLKAWILAREKPGNRAKSFASVIVDRIVGLYVLFLFAAAGIFISGLWYYADAYIHWICVGVLIATAVSTIGIAMILVPGFLEGPLVRAIVRIPKAGHAIGSLLDAIKIYRSKRLVLFLTSLATIPVHSLLTVSIYLLALGLGFGQVPFRDYFAIYPVSGIASTIPLNAGPAEAGIMLFYQTSVLQLPEASRPEKPPASSNKELKEAAWQEGLILALVYRFSTLLIAPIGAAYYFLGGRREVTEVLHEAEEDSEVARVLAECK